MSEFHLNKGIKRVFVVPGTLLSALDTLLTTKRRLQLKIRALTAHEVAVQLSSREPVYAEQVSYDLKLYEGPIMTSVLSIFYGTASGPCDSLGHKCAWHVPDEV